MLTAAAGFYSIYGTAVSFLVVPVIVVENKSPLRSLRESTKLLRETWGEQLVSNFSFGLVFFLLGMPGLLVGGLGVFLWTSGSAILAVICIALAILYFVILALIQSTLLCIFQAGLYFYACDKQLPEGMAFSQNTFNNAFRTRN